MGLEVQPGPRFRPLRSLCRTWAWVGACLCALTAIARGQAIPLPRPPQATAQAPTLAAPQVPATQMAAAPAQGIAIAAPQGPAVRPLAPPLPPLPAAPDPAAFETVPLPPPNQPQAGQGGPGLSTRTFAPASAAPRMPRAPRPTHPAPYSGAPHAGRPGTSPAYTQRLPPTSPLSPGWTPDGVFGAPHPDEAIPLRLRYKYNFGGGYTNLSSPRETVMLNLQNQVTLDGTFFDLPTMPTAEQGFNIPFLRTYLYGNVTEAWQYQIATQSFLGQFNILDAFVNWHYDDRFNIRFGRGLSPMLYEYYAFSPAWEPVITNSMLFQLAGKRQQGLMFWGNVAEKTVQYQLGVFNGVSGAFYDLDRNLDLLGSLAWTPMAGTHSIFDSFGFGASFQTGRHDYALNQTGSAFTNGAGEPTTNINYITSSGIPFFAYNADTYADGNQTKIAPQFYWFNRFSVSAEYLYCTRELSLGDVRGATVQRGWYLNGSYFLTGERYTGNGLAGYTTIQPLRPYRPARGERGPGAWELAAQFSQISLNPNNFAFVAAQDAYASRCDQLMVGVNWWPNRYTRISLDNVFTWFNAPVVLGNAGTADQFNTVWMRVAMFF